MQIVTTRGTEMSMAELVGKVAIVTGAAKGIGAAIATAFAAEGAAVAINYATSGEHAATTVASIKAAGGRAIAIRADVTDRTDVERVFIETVRMFGPVDVLVNNAAVVKMEPLRDITRAEFERVFAVNVLGTIYTVQQALKCFNERGGSIINISSTSSINPGANVVTYAASKSAVDGLTRAMARELGSRAIRVNSIAPGITLTEKLESIGLVGGDFEKRMIERTPLGRVGKTEDIADVAVFLASDRARWITGEVVVAAGGMK